MPGGVWVNFSADENMSWKNDILPIFEYFTERTPGKHRSHRPYGRVFSRLHVFNYENVHLHLAKVSSGVPIRLTRMFLGSFIEHKRASITWHYRLADPEYG